MRDGKKETKRGESISAMVCVFLRCILNRHNNHIYLIETITHSDTQYTQLPTAALSVLLSTITLFCVNRI